MVGDARIADVGRNFGFIISKREAISEMIRLKTISLCVQAAINVFTGANKEARSIELDKQVRDRGSGELEFRVEEKRGVSL